MFGTHSEEQLRAATRRPFFPTPVSTTKVTSVKLPPQWEVLTPLMQAELCDLAERNSSVTYARPSPTTHAMLESLAAAGLIELTERQVRGYQRKHDATGLVASITEDGLKLIGAVKVELRVLETSALHGWMRQVAHQFIRTERKKERMRAQGAYP